ncbi:pyridoxamine 5'-phosphate oxidase [Kribbella rubisoli]|uniref:Pyridoxamine 5'-phosphate oxidase n=1 Tax=Kribbella rubisoli TaxID=3075929 RepID=A0A4Q7WMR0_9ACTN|nr:pyridoxamine 5'-phosphate oxidase [Kribbella rubisoli]
MSSSPPRAATWFLETPLRQFLGWSTVECRECRSSGDWQLASGMRPDALAKSLIDGNRYMVLGSVNLDGRPRGQVYFAPDGHSVVYRVSSLESRHSRSTAERPEVSMVVFDSAAYVITRQRRSRTTSWRDVSTPCSGHGFRDSGSSPRCGCVILRCGGFIGRASVGTPSTCPAGTRSMPLAAGVIAFAAGWVVAAALPASTREMRACLGHQGQGDGGCRSGEGAGRAGVPRSGQSPGTGLTGCRQRQAIRFRRSHRRSGTSPVCPTGLRGAAPGRRTRVVSRLNRSPKDSAYNVRQAVSSS